MLDWVLSTPLILSTPPDYFYVRIIQTYRFFSTPKLSATPSHNRTAERTFKDWQSEEKRTHFNKIYYLAYLWVRRAFCNFRNSETFISAIFGAFFTCCCLRMLLLKRQRKLEKSAFQQEGLCPKPPPLAPASLHNMSCSRKVNCAIMSKFLPLYYFHLRKLTTKLETNTHFFLYCPLFTNQRRTLLSTVKDIDSSLTNTNDSILTHILLFGKASLDTSASTLLLNATMNYIISTNRFEESLF